MFLGEMLVVAVVCLSSGDGEKQSAAIVTEALQRFRARSEQVRELELSAVWIDSQDGTVLWEETEDVWLDRFGRVKLRFNRKSDAGQMVRIDVFDGESTFNIIHDPSRTKTGLLKSPAQGDETMYRQANINAGVHPPERGLHVIRNPWTIGESEIEGDLRTIITSSRVGDIQTSWEQDARYLQIKYSKESAAGQQECLATLDCKQGWNVVLHRRTTTKTGQLESEMRFDYVEDENGIWVPSAGRLKRWKPDSAPTAPFMDWQFVVKSIKINDPSFDEHAFEPALEPETWVTDNRYGVAYWVGQEHAIGTQLTNLALRAKALEAEQGRHRSARDERVPISAPVKSASQFSRSQFLIVNAVALAIVVVCILLKRRAPLGS